MTTITIQTLKNRRESLKVKLSELDKKIREMEKAEEENEQKNMLRLLKARGVTVKQIQQLLDGQATPSVAQKDSGVSNAQH